ncbi:chromosome partitioning protein ParB [Erwinia sp. S38]|uniref:ParB/RepB/Spo0J family partition protein n=1 Tax=Erwinia sp. S38 TaxID=2769338 RepID=UPI00190A83AA|nr:chromosome partitioning protein ParB [Erwinia sp. S38]MBK0003150.1 chromosome partitioning protein ParB [Erwinia sp. S38]
MSSLSIVHKNREESATDIVPRKTYFAGLKEFYVEPGYNVRDIDQDHVREFRDAFIAGEEVPALIVQVTEQGLKIIDGHHRYYGAVMATEEGHEVARLECKDAKGTEADRIALMVTSSQGRALLPLERAGAYQRLKNQGWENFEIAKKVKRSVADVEHHLQLLECGDELIGMVKAKEVSATTAVSMSREFGTKAGAVATEKLAEARASGKKKLTKAVAIPQFNAGKARRLVELMAVFDFTDDGYTAPDDVYLEAMGILAEYREKHGQPQPTVKPSEPEASDEYLPLSKQDIIDHSGVAVWACAAAAFGEKDEYTFHESKYAHTWAADSVENPQVVTIPADAIQRALDLIDQHDSSSALREWVDKTYTDEGQREDMFDRFLTVYRENRTAIKSVPAYLSLLQCTLSASWSNIRTLRLAIRQAIYELTDKPAIAKAN